MWKKRSRIMQSFGEMRVKKNKIPFLLGGKNKSMMEC